MTTEKDEKREDFLDKLKEAQNELVKLKSELGTDDSTARGRSIDFILEMLKDKIWTVEMLRSM